VCGLAAIWPASHATGTPWRHIPSRTSFSSQTPITIESQPCGCFGQTEPAQPPSPPLAKKPDTARAWVLVGEASAHCLPQTEPSLDHRVRFTSCSCSSSKVCTGGLSKVGEIDLYSADYGLSAKPSLVAVVVRCGRGGGADRSALSMGLAS